MLNNSIAIVTATLYPNWYVGRAKNISKYSEQDRMDKVRGDLAIKMLTEAKRKGFQIIVIDAGSSKTFIEKLTQIGIKITPAKNKGLSPNRQQGFQKASQLIRVKVICWVEPEKVSIVKDCLPGAVIPILNNQTDIIVPKRDQQAFNTYPTYQAELEKRANKKWNKILKDYHIEPLGMPELDIYFGPKFFNNDPKLIKIFLKRYHFKDKLHKLDVWSNAIVLPIISALKQGYKVISININYQHPKQQTAIEKNSRLMKRKRQIQYQSILSTTEYFITYLL